MINLPVHDQRACAEARRALPHYHAGFSAHSCFAGVFCGRVLQTCLVVTTDLALERCNAIRLRAWSGSAHLPRRFPFILQDEEHSMSFSMSKASLPALEIGLNALSGVLDKGAAFAAAKKIDPSVLLNWRLAVDMFPLTRQVQIATDLAKNGAARLAGIEPPRFEDNEKTFEELKARVAKAVAFIKSADAGKIDAAGERELTFPLGPSNKGQMKADDYLNHFVLPNFYFHCTAAYAILRLCGVEVGKQDYLGAIPMKMT
jgi:hypothetical protein